MSFIVLEDQRKPLPKRQVAVFASFRIVKPLLKMARFTFRGSRFLLQKAVWVVRGDRPTKAPTAPETVAEVKNQAV